MTVLITVVPSVVCAKGGGIFLQLGAGGGHYLIADDVAIADVPGGYVTSGSWSGIGIPDIGVSLGSNFGEFLALEINWETRHRELTGFDLYRSDMGLSLGLRAYPLGLGTFASFFGVSAGLAVRGLQASGPCPLACDPRHARADELVRPMVALSSGVEWYPFGDIFHWLARWDLRWAIATAGGENDIWMGVAVGLGIRLR